MKISRHWSFVAVWLLSFLNASVSDSLPKAQNLTWSSFNFKTLLTWSPKPNGYLYTVEYSKLAEDNQRPGHCLQMDETECDLTAELKDLKSKYRADVVSEPLLDIHSDLVEFPRTKSELFCPYQDTVIGSPTVRYEQRNEERKIILFVEDIPTAVYDAQGRQLTIQDIFKTDLRYKVTYNKAESSGKKLMESTSSRIELTNLDKEESYCFSVQVYIPSRTFNKQLGDHSQIQCTSIDRTIFNQYSPAVIGGGILAIIAIVLGIAVTVIFIKKRQKAMKREKEGVPLNKV